MKSRVLLVVDALMCGNVNLDFFLNIAQQTHFLQHFECKQICVLMPFLCLKYIQ